MRILRRLAAVFLLSISVMGCSLIHTARPGPDLNQATLIFSDEFNDTNLDTSKWNATSYNLWTAKNAYNPAMVSVGGGNLILQLQPIPWMGQAYSGGQVDTDHKFLPVYGYFEARLKPPRGTGFHASWWLWPDDNVWPPEMDIAEFRGFEPTAVYVANRWFDPAQPENDAHDQVNCEGPDYTQDFHIFGMDWGPEAIVFYIDGQECYRTTTNISAKPFRLQLDLALGGWAGWPPDETTVFPAYFLVDYVRVYRLRDTTDKAALNNATTRCRDNCHPLTPREPVH